MNLNSSNSHDNDLRHAVQQQLDLIIKMQEQRKALKKQNKLLHQKLKQTTQCMQKYQREMKSMETNTDQNIDISNFVKEKMGEEKVQREVKGKGKENFMYQDTGVQIDLVLGHQGNNSSKLAQAQSLLKVLDLYQSQNQSTIREQSKKNISYYSKKQLSPPKQKPQKIPLSTHQSDKNIAGQMVKLTKQLNLLKKQLKQIDHKYKLREKQIKDLKKCIETKNQALQKSRKQFNQLSMLLNTDKYKSIRTLEQQVQNLRAKIITQEQSSKIKVLLTQLTQQYEGYRKESQRKIDIFVSQLANKEKQIESLKLQLKNSVLRESSI